MGTVEPINNAAIVQLKARSIAGLDRNRLTARPKAAQSEMLGRFGIANAAASNNALTSRLSSSRNAVTPETTIIHAFGFTH